MKTKISKRDLMKILLSQIKMVSTRLAELDKILVNEVCYRKQRTLQSNRKINAEILEELNKLIKFEERTNA